MVTETESDYEYTSASTDQEPEYKPLSYRSERVLTGIRKHSGHEYLEADRGESMSYLRQSVEYEGSVIQNQD